MQTRFVVSTALAVLIYAVPALAHHSFAAVFDRDNPVEVTGSVTEVEWMNPHVWFHIDVENENGEIENWGFEMGSPNGLIRRGWNHNSLQVGNMISVSGVRAKDNSLTGAVRTVTLSTGDSLFGAQNESN